MDLIIFKTMWTDDNFQKTMWWLQCTLFLLAKSGDAQNSSAFDFSHLNLEEEHAVTSEETSSQVKNDPEMQF